MYNLSKGVEEQGIRKGIQKGLEQGRQQGIQKGLEQGAWAMADTLRELNIADSIIINKICEKFHLSEESAKKYLV